MTTNPLQQTALSRPKRLHERGSAEREVVNAILDAALLCHIGYIEEVEETRGGPKRQHPAVIPTAYWREGDYVYWHGSSASRMIRSLSDGRPLCLTVSLLDALVLARSAFHHSVNYRSVMLFGVAQVITDSAEKIQKLNHFIEHLYPGRLTIMRPMNTQEIKATALLRLKIDEGAAKMRQGPPKDDDEDMGALVWAGLAEFSHKVVKIIPDEDTETKMAKGEKIAMPAFHPSLR